MASGFRQQLVADLESGAFARQPGTLDLLLDMTKHHRRTSFFYRLLDQAWLFPLTSFVECLRQLNEQIARHGLFAGARREFARYGLQLDVKVSPDAQRLFDSGQPIFFVGNHPCSWGHDFVALAASLAGLCSEKPGFAVLAWILPIALVPALVPHSEPVFHTQQTIERQIRDEHGVTNREFGFYPSLFRSWSPDLPAAFAIRRTYQSLQNLASRWLNGQHVLIYPASVAGDDALWFSGLGRIVRFAAEHINGKTDFDPQILFFRMTGATNLQMLLLPVLSRFHPARLLGLFAPRRIEVYYGPVIRLRERRGPFMGMSNRDASRQLQSEYRAYFGR
ncbi:MAG: hypothetical protein N3D11_04670 [Candidatus Sumerlaeia bacterium]|nr:hypothetical protein [Candidatus Sumerlaeia bacterium]